MEHLPGGELEQDSSPFSPAAFWGMIALAVFGYMFGPAITAFFGLAWPKRPGAKVLAVVGILCMLLHVAIFIVWQAAPSWHPAFKGPNPPV